MPAVLNEASPWIGGRGQFIVLWHGCTDRDRIGIEKNGVDLNFSRPDLDFGRGFYTTTLRRQAAHWAFRRFDYRRTPQKGNRPVVLRFRLQRTELARMAWLAFVLARYENEDYWSLVQHCRQSRTARNGRAAVINDHSGPVAEHGHNWFDVVLGPVVAEWRQRAALMDMDQVSFHTTRSVSLLNGLIASKETEKYSWHPIS